MGALILYQLRQCATTTRWPAPLGGFVVLSAVLAGFELQTGHGAVFVSAGLVAVTGWFGWLVSSGSGAPLWHLDMIAAGGRERVLVGRWLTALGCAVPPLLVALVVAATDSRPWAAVAAVDVLAAVFGATLGVQLGVWLPRRTAATGVLAQDLTAVGPLAGLLILGASVLGPLPYLGTLAGFAVLLLTVGLGIRCLTEHW